MKEFLSRVLAFALIQLALFGLVVARFDPARSDHYLAATHDKHRRLAATVAPRVILVGGSNVAFGFHSDRIESALDMPVVNMALAGGVGLSLMLREVEDEVHAGDIVVFSIEYDLFGGGCNRALIRQLIAQHPASVQYLKPDLLLRTASENGLALISEIVRASLGAGYRPDRDSEPVSSRAIRRGFNQQGDFVAHYGEPSLLPATAPPTPVEQKVKRGWLMKTAVERELERFVELARAKGARVLYSFPPRPPVTYANEKATTVLIHAQLQTIPGLELLDAPGDQVYPLTQFYDSEYHLTGDGSAVRTGKLIRSIQEQTLRDAAK